jgi:hypothetical protein
VFWLVGAYDPINESAQILYFSKMSKKSEIKFHVYAWTFFVPTQVFGENEHFILPVLCKEDKKLFGE